MRTFFINNNNKLSYQDNLRIKYFSDFFNITQSRTLPNLLNKKEQTLVISDGIKTIDLLLLVLFARKKINLILWSLEMYNIEENSLHSELNQIFNVYKKSKGFISFKKLVTIAYIFFKKYPRIFLIKYLNKNKIKSLIVSSNLRKKFIKEKFPKLKIFVLRNSIVKSYIKSDPQKTLMLYSDFIIIAGNINNFDDFLVLTKFCEKNELKLLHFGKKDDNITKKIVKYKNTVNFLGFIESSAIIEIQKKALAVAVLYIKDTINQKYSASSKLLEAIFFSNKIIVSRNTGALNELKEFSYSNYFLIDELNKKSIKDLREKNFNAGDIDNRCCFENECNNLYGSNLFIN